MPGPLNDIRVLDLTQGLCGPFCTQILRDFGAEVIKIEPPSGDVSRRRGTCRGRSSIPYMSVNRGKKSVLLDLSRQEEKEVFLRLVETAEVIAEDFGPDRSREMGIGYETVRSRKPDILYLSITGYGQDGMYKDYSDEDAIVQAISGFMSITGENGGAYTRAGIPLADVLTGIYGAIGVLAGIIYRRRTSESLFIDLPKLNVMLSAMPDVFSKYYNTGETTRPKGCRHQLAGYFGPVETKDGIIICMAAQDHQFKAMTEVLGLEGLEEDARFNTMHKRCVHIAELEPIIFSRSRNMTMAELTEKLLSRKIPAGPVNSLEKILKSDYVSYHNLLMEVTDSAEGTVKVIGPPVKFGQFEMRTADFVSQPGEHTEEIITEILKEGKKGKLRKEKIKGQKTERPLTGIRILDLTRFMSGPLGMQILEHLGAEVIKIERGDQVSEFSRSTEPTFGNTSAYFMSINSGKKDVMLNLNNEEHRELFLRLAEQCDIVADNFRPGVTERLRIAYEDVKMRKPDIIYSTVSGFGYTGPYRTLGCVDTVSQAMSGFMSLTGRNNGEPVRAGSSIADICASLYEAAAALASLIHRDKTGEGGMVDTPMLSSMLALSCVEAAEYLNHGIIVRRVGNRDRERALFQTFPASDGEVMIEAASDEHFAAFARLLKMPELLEDSRFATAGDRMIYLEDLEHVIVPVTESMTMTELAEACRKAGIPAGEVNTVERIVRSGYIEQQHMIERVHDSKEGDFKILGLPIKFDKFKIPDEKMVPQPGEHTVEVLKNLLGLSEEEIQIFI